MTDYSELKGTPLKVVLNETQEEVDGFVAQIDFPVGLTIVADVSGTEYAQNTGLNGEAKVFCLHANSTNYDYTKSFEWAVEQIKQGKLVIDDDPYPAVRRLFGGGVHCAFE